MEDTDIIALYFRRDQSAIWETDARYGGLCRTVAARILGSESDAEERVNDTYLRAWNAIPPERPGRLGVWLARVTRNLALDRWRRDHRRKRFEGVELVLEELGECLPGPSDPQRELEGRELTEFLNTWLGSLPEGDRRLFLRRYWRGDGVGDLARELGASPNSVTKRLTRLRARLRAALEKEGYTL